MSACCEDYSKSDDREVGIVEVISYLQHWPNPTQKFTATLLTLIGNNGKGDDDVSRKAQ
jgi:hypothetical protein